MEKWPGSKKKKKKKGTRATCASSLAIRRGKDVFQHIFTDVFRVDIWPRPGETGTSPRLEMCTLYFAAAK